MMAEKNPTQVMKFFFARVAAFLLLIWATNDHAYSYYTLLRIVVFGVGGYAAFLASNPRSNFWLWTFAVTAFLFNPVIPVHLDRGTWGLINIVAGLMFFVSIFLFQKPKFRWWQWILMILVSFLLLGVIYNWQPFGAKKSSYRAQRYYR